MPVDPDQVIGFAFGFNAYTDTPNSGTIWIDNFRTLGEGAPVAEAIQQEQSQEVEEVPQAAADQPDSEPEQMEESEESESDETGSKRNLCPGSTAMIGFSIIAVGIIQTRKLSKRERRKIID